MYMWFYIDVDILAPHIYTHISDVYYVKYTVFIMLSITSWKLFGLEALAELRNICQPYASCQEPWKWERSP